MGLAGGAVDAEVGLVGDQVGSAVRANASMRLPLLTHLSGGRSAPIPDHAWLPTVEAALSGDPPAIEAMFAAAARWANRLAHTRCWLEDSEEEVVALMWSTLAARPVSSDAWRTLVLRRLGRREYRPSPELACDTDWLERRTPAGVDVADQVVNRLDAHATLVALGPFPAGVGPYLNAVLADDDPPPAAAHCARQWRYTYRQAVA